MFARRPAAVIFAPRAKCSVGYGWSVRGEYLYVDFDSYTTFQAHVL
jgi:hypothetical protein